MEIAYRLPHDDPIQEGGASKQRSKRPWQRRRIPATGLDITRRADSTLRVDPRGTSYRDDEPTQYIATLLPHGADPRTVLLLPSYDTGLLVDGFPPLTVTELADGMEISVGADSLYCHGTGPAEIELFDGAENERCARCGALLESGDAIQRCTLCASAHHEGVRTDPKRPDLYCASYDPVCGRCKEPWRTTPADPPGEQHVR